MIRTILGILLVLSLSGFPATESRDHAGVTNAGIEYSALNCRKHTAVITEFGAVGDGKTSNTVAFRKAVDELSRIAKDGGAQLVVPPGKWLTGSFNLTSHFTLFIQKGATILASQDPSEYPEVEPLPSYQNKRFNSLISGTNLTDVVITGNNGTINGQGKTWWNKFKKGEIKDRPFMIEITYSENIQISNITLINSPNWFVHPVYCKNLILKGLTILAPVNVPNTDGINPDSCSNTLIEDCYIVSGDDCIAIKSGLDKAGIEVGIPTQQLSIRRLTCISPKSAGVALGSEMSGGISDVRIEDVTLINTESGIRIKSARGRGGYVKDIYARRLTMKTMKYVFWMNGDYDSHPGPWDPKDLPVVKNINYRDMTAENVTMSGSLDGIKGDPYTGICISNVKIKLSRKPKKMQWECTNVAGITSRVSPPACSSLPEKGSPVDCAFPADKIPIESVVLKKCSV